MTTEKEEVTPWFPGSVEPLADRPGKYERSALRTKGPLHYWDGNNWRLWCGGPRCWHQQLPWRGLSTPPATYAKGSK